MWETSSYTDQVTWTRDRVLGCEADSWTTPEFGAGQCPGQTSTFVTNFVPFITIVVDTTISFRITRS